VNLSTLEISLIQCLSILFFVKKITHLYIHFYTKQGCPLICISNPYLKRKVFLLLPVFQKCYCNEIRLFWFFNFKFHNVFVIRLSHFIWNNIHRHKRSPLFFWHAVSLQNIHIRVPRREILINLRGSNKFAHIRFQVFKHKIWQLKF